MDLDKLEHIKRVDRNNMLGLLDSFPEQCENAIKIAENITVKTKSKPEKIAVCGMGGSAITGDILRNLLLDKNISVFRDYELPKYVDKDYLVFVSSYSGNTEETLSMFSQAVRRGCKIIAITSGGKLRKLSRKKGIPIVEIPGGLLPRAALGFLFFPMVVILKKMGFVKIGNFKELVKNLKEVRNEIKPEVKTRDNISKRIAKQLFATIPVIYSTENFKSLSLRAKTQFHENSKIPSFSECFPEINHNSIQGWEASDLNWKLSVILLRDEEEEKKVRKTIEFNKKIIRKKANKLIELWSIYKSRLSRMFTTIYVLDFTSFYLGILYGKDPSGTKLINEMKKILR